MIQIFDFKLSDVANILDLPVMSECVKMAIEDVLKKDSSQPILDGLNPGPLVEIEFWKAKAINLENISEQVRILIL